MMETQTSATKPSATQSSTTRSASSAKATQASANQSPTTQSPTPESPTTPSAASSAPTTPSATTWPPTSSPKALIKQLHGGEPINAKQARSAMQQIMEGEWDSAALAAYLILLSLRDDLPEVVAASARVMREKALRVHSKEYLLLDVVGSGGDGMHSINVSTLAALTVAAAGVPVAKHGNRAMSGRFGSADVLEALGIPIELSASQAEQMLKQHRFTFMFAPRFHPAMKYAVPTRRALGIPTLFNDLGPLTNPARANCYLLGTRDLDKMPLFAQALRALGIERALVVHGEDGMDEITLAAPTRIIEINGRGDLLQYRLEPEQFGLRRVRAGVLSLQSAEESVQLAHAYVNGEAPVPHTDLILLNAGAAIYAAGGAPSIRKGLQRVQEALSSGALRRLVKALRHF